MNNQPTQNFFGNGNAGNAAPNSMFGNTATPPTTMNFFSQNATNTTAPNTNAGLPAQQTTFGNQQAPGASNPPLNFFNNTATTGSINLLGSKTDNENKTEAPSKIRRNRRFYVW